MSWLRRLLARDEGLGRKDDDRKPLNSSTKSSAWPARRTAPALRKRTIYYGICALLFLYVFIKNIPTELGPTARYVPGQANDEVRKLAQEPSDLPIAKPRKPTTPSEAEEHYHDGPIKFYMLASSLHSVVRLGGQHDSNKNVLFASSSLKSASEIIPLACEMARWDRNDVHFAVMGREDMEISEIKKLNGAEDDCNIHWHDARPDYSRWSSDLRMEISVKASMEHIQNFVHPQAIIIDTSSREDQFFISALRSKAMDLKQSVIELPEDATENMMWVARLDSASLAAWTTTYVDLLVQAPTGSSGSLIRLLKSIQEADYFGIRRPHLTIELPAEIDPPTWRYLESLVWPPLDWSGAARISQVTLRHRIARRTTTEYEASARLVESFYPARLKDSHVLLLSPQVELSPLYYHYLIYNLLEYRYSAHGKAAKDAPNLMGITLELPAFYLNDSAPLIPPMKKGEAVPFLWQAPNSNAALYFGDRWLEFHSFLTARLSKPPLARRKMISKKYPSWLEFLLEFMRARGYSLIYPNFPTGDGSIATIHDELYQGPEEFLGESRAEDAVVPELDPSMPLVKDYDQTKRRAPHSSENKLLSADLMSIIPNSGDLPTLSDMPLISYNGINMSRELSYEAAMAFSQAYQREVGGCQSPAETSGRHPNSAIDLFCHLEEVYDPLRTAMLHGTGAHPVPYSQPHDSDMIPAEQVGNVKTEASVHLARQGGLPKPVPPPQYVNTNELDDSDARQNEFRLQVERQAQQAHQAKQSTAGAEEEPKEEMIDIPTQDVPESTHGGFSKQVPKVAI